MNDDKTNNNSNSKIRKRIIMIIIIIIIILLLITSCTSNFWGKIGSVFTIEKHFNIENITNDKERITNKDLMFDIKSLTMNLSDENKKVTYYYKNINPKNFACKSDNTKIATCYVGNGYVVVIPKGIGDCTITLLGETNGKIYEAKLPVTVKKNKRYIYLSKQSGTIDIKTNNIDYIPYNLIGLNGIKDLKVEIDKNIADVKLYKGTIKVTAKKVGTAKITIKGIYKNKEYKAYYDLKVIKSSTKKTVNKDNNSYLKSLTTKQSTLKFNSKVYKYYLSVPNKTTKITFKANLSSNKSKIKYVYNGKVVKSLKDLKLKVGNNKLVITVTAENGNKTSYELTINRAKKVSSRSSKLADLTVSKGKLTPSFNPEILNYEVEVDNDTEKIDINAKKADEKSKVKYKYNGKEVENLEDLELSVGDNKVVIEVTDEKGKTTTYNVNIKRKEKTTSNYLKDIVLSDDLHLNEEFKKDNYSYTVDAEYNQNSFTLKGIKEDENSTLTYRCNGKEIDPNNIELKEGKNEIEIEVTDKNNNSRVYKVTVNKKVRTIAFELDEYIIPASTDNYTIKYIVYDDGIPTENYKLEEIEVFSDTYVGKITINKGSITINPTINKALTTKLHIKHNNKEDQTTLIFEELKYYLKSLEKYKIDILDGIGQDSIVLDTNLFQGSIVEETIPGGIRLRDSDNPDIYIDLLTDDDVTLKYKRGTESIVVEVTLKSPGLHNIEVKSSKDNLSLNIEIEAIEKYTLIIDANGGFFDSFTARYEYKYSKNDEININLEDYNPYKIDDPKTCLYFKLKEYNTDPQGNGKSYSKDYIITNLDDNLVLYAIYEKTSEKVIIKEEKKLYLTDVDLFHNEEYYNLYNIDKIIYPGATGSYLMYFHNNTGKTINITSITLKENNEVCQTVGCINMAYIIKDIDNTYTNGKDYETLNNHNQTIDTEKSYSVPVTIENGEEKEISLLWKWKEENDTIDTLIGNKAIDLKTMYSLIVSIEFTTESEECAP